MLSFDTIMNNVKIALKEKLNSDEFPKNAKQNANLILWLFYRMNLIEKTEKNIQRLKQRKDLYFI